MRQEKLQAEGRLSHVISSSPAVLFSLDLTGEQIRLSWISDNVLSLFGYQVQECLAPGWWQACVHPDDLAPSLDRWAVLLQDGRHSLEFRFHHKDGSYRWVRDEIRLLRDATGRPREGVGSWSDVTERKRAEESLLETNEKLQSLILASPLAISTLDRNGNVLTWNPAAQRTFGWSAAEVLGRPLPIIPPDQNDASRQMFAQEMKGETFSALELPRQRKDGSRVDVSLWTAPLHDANGKIFASLAFIADITERKQLEEQFRQAQKMEAVGKLAGGVAHDFNNLLTVINGSSEIILNGLLPTDPLRERIEQIKKAGERAARLTRQLLAFSRKQVLVPVVLDLNSLLAEMEKMVGRLIGEDVELTVRQAPDLWQVTADPGQVEQVIMNIVVNGRDAMPQGGKLTLATANVVLDGECAGWPPEAQPGEYVSLEITDTGCGMSRDTKARLFEPFF